MGVLRIRKNSWSSHNSSSSLVPHDSHCKRGNRRGILIFLFDAQVRKCSMEKRKCKASMEKMERVEKEIDRSYYHVTI